MSTLNDLFRPTWSDEEDQKLNLGIALYKQKDYQSAILLLRDLLTQLPTSAAPLVERAHINLAYCYEELGELESGLNELELAKSCWSRDLHPVWFEAMELEIELYLTRHPALKTDDL